MLMPKMNIMKINNFFGRFLTMNKLTNFLKNNSKVFFLWIFLATVFSLVVLPGYDVFVSDHAIYLPVIFQALDPGLFKNDILLSFNQSTFTIFDEVVVVVTKLFNGSIIFALFFLTFFPRGIFIYAVFRLVFYFSRKQWLSWLAVFLTLPGFIVYGTVSSTFDVFLTPRLIAVALGLLCLVGLLEKKYWLAVISLVISIAFHPLTAFVFAIIFYFSLFLDCNLTLYYKKLFSLLPIFFVLILIFIIYFFGPGILIIMDKVWLEIIKDRNPSVFILVWPLQYSSAWIYLFASALIFLVAKVELKKTLIDQRKKIFFHLFFLVPMFLFYLSFLFVDLLNLSFFTQFQLARALLIWKIFTPIFMLLVVDKLLQNKKNNIFFIFSLLGILTAFVFKESLVFIFFPSFFIFWLNYRYPNIKPFSFRVLRTILMVLFVLLIGVLLWWWKKHAYLDNIFNLLVTLLIAGFLTCFYFFNYLVLIFKKFFLVVVIVIFIFKIWPFSIYPACQRNFADVELQEWIKTNTTKDSLFLTEPFTSQDESSILRLCALRSVFFSRKDGAQVVYNRAYALEWQKRRELVKDLINYPERLKEISKQYKIDYVLSGKGVILDIPFVFSNEKYFIYSMR